MTIAYTTPSPLCVLVKKSFNKMHKSCINMLQYDNMLFNKLWNMTGAALMTESPWTYIHNQVTCTLEAQRSSREHSCKPSKMFPSLDSTLHQRKRWSIKWSNKMWIAWIACPHHEELPLFRLPQRQILTSSVTRSKGSQQKMKSQQTTQLPKKTLNPVFWDENSKNCSYQEWRSTFKTARQAPIESKDQENRSAAVSPENKAAKKKSGARQQ
jgi:hypothetical protein